MARPGNRRCACQTDNSHLLSIYTVNLVKPHRSVLIVQNNLIADDKGDQLYTVSKPGKRSQANLNRKIKSYLFTDTLVYPIAH